MNNFNSFFLETKIYLKVKFNAKTFVFRKKKRNFCALKRCKLTQSKFENQ